MFAATCAENTAAFVQLSNVRRLSADSSEPAIPTLTLQLSQAYVSKHRQGAGVCVCAEVVDAQEGK